MIVAQLSVSPVGKNVGLSRYVKKVIEVLRNEPISIETNAMATVIEAEDIETLFAAVKKAHNCLFETGVQRVITELKIDDRRDKNATIASKLNDIK